MWLRALLAGGLLAGLLGACAMVDPVDSRYDTVGRSLAKGRDQAIFLNLIRASHDYPLAFTTIANVTPAMTNTSSFALPSFSLGPPNCVLTTVLSAAPQTRTSTCTYPTGIPGASVGVSNSTASNATAVSTNFNVSTEETGSFYEGFLKPIDLQILDYFIRQDYPRELLFWLFADSFQFQIGPSPLNAVGFQYDPPLSYGCPRDLIHGLNKHLCFREWVWIALISGLTVEEKTIVKEGGSGGRDAPSSGGSKGAKGPETTIVARFCFSPELERQSINQMDALNPEIAKDIRAQFIPFPPNYISPICGTWKDGDAQKQAKAPQDDTFTLKMGPYSFKIVPRSAYGVFQFLGNILKMQREHAEPAANAFHPHRDELLGQETDTPPLLVTTNNEPLITVLQDTNADCFSQTWFYDGQYCVPENARNTKLIFSLLAQLIAIETTASDLSITPVVRVIE